MAQDRRRGRNKTTVACCLREFSESNDLGARRVHGRRCLVNRRASDFRNIQGDSAILWNTVTNPSCDCWVSRLADEEGQGSHPARKATQKRGCQPQRIVPEPTERNYPFSHVVPYYRRERVTTGGDPRWRAISEERKVGGSKVPARCSSTVQADLTMGSGRGKAGQ